MVKYQIVLDTNVFVAALRSRRGASYRLLTWIGKDKFEANISVPLVLEYESVAKRLVQENIVTEVTIDSILNYMCRTANQKEIFFLWRPTLKDPKDDMVLELAFAASCDYIVTYNKSDFQGVEKFGIQPVTPKEFLKVIGDAV